MSPRRRPLDLPAVFPVFRPLGPSFSVFVMQPVPIDPSTGFHWTRGFPHLGLLTHLHPLGRLSHIWFFHIVLARWERCLSLLSRFYLGSAFVVASSSLSGRFWMKHHLSCFEKRNIHLRATSQNFSLAAPDFVDASNAPQPRPAVAIIDPRPVLSPDLANWGARSSSVSRALDCPASSIRLFSETSTSVWECTQHRADLVTHRPAAFRLARSSFLSSALPPSPSKKSSSRTVLFCFVLWFFCSKDAAEKNTQDS